MGQQHSSYPCPNPNIPQNHAFAKATAYAPAPVPVKVEAQRPQPQPWTVEITQKPHGQHFQTSGSKKAPRRHSLPVEPVTQSPQSTRRSRPLFSSAPLKPIDTSVASNPDYYRRSRKTRPLFHSPTDNEGETGGEDRYLPTRGDLLQARTEVAEGHGFAAGALNGRNGSIIPSKKPGVVPPPADKHPSYLPASSRTRSLFSSASPAQAVAEAPVSTNVTPFPTTSGSPPPKRKRRFSLLPEPPNFNRSQSLILIDKDRPAPASTIPRRSTAYAQVSTVPILKSDQPYEHDWPAKKPGRKRKLSLKRLFNPQLDLDDPPGEHESHQEGKKSGKKKSVRFLGQDKEGNIVDRDYYARNGALRAEAAAGVPPSPLVTPYHISDHLPSYSNRSSRRKGKPVAGGKPHPSGAFSGDRFFPDPGMSDYEDRAAARLARAEMRAARIAKREVARSRLEAIGL